MPSHGFYYFLISLFAHCGLFLIVFHQPMQQENIISLNPLKAPTEFSYEHIFQKKQKKASKPNKKQSLKPKKLTDNNRAKEKIQQEQENQTFSADLTKSSADNTPKEIRELLKELVDKINENKSYPYTARRLKQTGTVFIAFEVLASGKLQNIKIIKRSQYKKLDESAFNQIASIEQISPFPASLKKDKIAVKVPIDFNL